MSLTEAAMFAPRLRYRRIKGYAFAALCVAMMSVAVLVLGALLGQVWSQGHSRLSLGFLTNRVSDLTPERSGVVTALWGTIWVISLTAAVAVPVGVGAAVYLQEYAGKNRFTGFIRLNIANLAGVPSIVYGLLGLAVLVRLFAFDKSILSGGLTMAMLVLPVIIIATVESLAAVPNSIRAASFALGATRWQTVWCHVLPAAVPGICTGTILALSRAVGEAAPLIVVGALLRVSDVPSGLWDGFTVLPVQIYYWAQQPGPEYQELAAAGILVLLAVLLSMNALAIGIRTWQQRRV